MIHEEKLVGRNNMIPSKQGDVDYSEEVETLVTIFRKQHRPWRNKVRKKAAKEAKRKLKKENGNECTISSSDVQIMRKKRRSRVKRINSNGSTENGAMNRQEINDREGIGSSLFRYINEQLYTMSGAKAMELFRKDPQAFKLYHKGYQKQANKWPFNPVRIIIQWIKSLKHNGLVIADLGCGNATIADALSHIATVHSFDLVAVNDRVMACDMSMMMKDGGYFVILEFMKTGKVVQKRPIGLILKPCLYKKR
ncbi:putative methyltransferase family protein [Brugia pahangi]